MTPERFRAIIEAYGSEPGRWPDAERAAALAFRKAGGDASVVDEAAAIDDLLFAYRLPAPSPGLQHDIIAAAPRLAWPRLRLRLWWSGLMLAAGAAGLLAGSAAAAFVPGALPVPAFLHADASLAELGDGWDAQP